MTLQGADVHATDRISTQSARIDLDPSDIDLRTDARPLTAGSAARPGAAMELSDVSKVFPLGRKGEVHALAGVDLHVAPGEFVALLGPSGCGKSTILRLLAGLDEPTTGQVRIDGTHPSELVAGHRLGVAFQDHALLPWATIADNVALPFRVAGRAVDRDRIASLLDLVGIAEFADARPKQLSGGMRQRASIARALALQPDVLLLDEPFGALDAVTRRRMNIELQDIWARDQVTTLLVTHSVDEAVFLADRVVVMTGRPGRIRSIRIPGFARPRGPELLRDPDFHEIVDELTLELDAEPAA
jgi:NitT/TauT family transport system ATP-binding protein